MEYDKIKKSIINGEKIYNLKLRVTYYCRVSTDSDVQLNSLDNQIDYYTNFINSQINWEFVPGYIDEGVTGVRVDKRINFKKMINDAELNKFDLIITKEVSRFARDLEDSIHYIRLLKSYGVGVFFENQNLNTFDDNSELILNIMFNLAQEESRKLSNRIKFGHKEAIKKGHVLGSSNITGYKKEKCKLVIIPEEAILIKKIFELYSTGEYGFYKLSKKLSELGYYNRMGRLFDKDSLKKIISNPKYKGFYRGHIHEIIDYRTKKRKNIPVKEQVIYKCNDNTIPPIVSEELWNKANEILEGRTLNYQTNNHFSGALKYPFSSKIYCMEHNTSFQRCNKGNKNNPTWSCSLYLQYRIQSCSSPIIPEKDLYNIMEIIMKKIIINKNKITNDMIDLYNEIRKNNNYELEINNIEKEIKKNEDKKNLALELIIAKEINKSDLKLQFEKIKSNLDLLNKKKNDILKQLNLLKNNSNYQKLLSKSIKCELNKDLIDEFIRNFIDKIIISKIDNNRNNIKLDIFLNILEIEKKNINNKEHINNLYNNKDLYLNGKSLSVTKNIRSNCKKNIYTYNVYIDNYILNY